MLGLFPKNGGLLPSRSCVWGRSLPILRSLLYGTRTVLLTNFCALRVPRLCYFLHQENCPGQVLVMEGPEPQVHKLYIDLLPLLSTWYSFYPFHCLLLPQRQRELENQRRYKRCSRKRKTMLKVRLRGVVMRHECMHQRPFIQMNDKVFPCVCSSRK